MAASCYLYSISGDLSTLAHRGRQFAAPWFAPVCPSTATLRSKPKPLMMSGFVEVTRLFSAEQPLTMSGRRFVWSFSQFGNVAEAILAYLSEESRINARFLRALLLKVNGLLVSDRAFVARFWSSVRPDTRSCKQLACM
jgi:hypothetical protein